MYVIAMVDLEVRLPSPPSKHQIVRTVRYDSLRLANVCPMPTPGLASTEYTTIHQSHLHVNVYDRRSLVGHVRVLEPIPTAACSCS